MDKTANGIESYDVAIIGAGVCGASIARTLSRYKIRVALLEKEVDVSFGTSKANSGIVHGGFHHPGKYLKSRLEIEGAAQFDRLRRELGFPFTRCGILVAALHPDEMLAVEHLYRQGRENGAPGIELCSRERILELEPKLSPEVIGGLYAPSGGIVESYRFVFSMVESAKKNGVELFASFQVSGAQRSGEEWVLQSADGRTLRTRYAVNAAGLFADEVSRCFGAESFEISARKGEYFLLDRLAPCRPERVVFPVPSSVSKGMLVIPTVEGTTLIGPTADIVDDKTDVSTTAEKLALITASARSLVPSVSERDVITSFAGLRPVLGEDFYIDFSAKVPALVHVAGIQSPGLTASPAIGEYVKNLLLRDGLELSEDPSWDPYLPSPVKVRALAAAERSRLIAENPAYGNIVCRCEEISEGEIVDAIRRGHTTLDGVKFYTRAQMGRCQGGFCSYKIIKLIMRETGMTWDQVTKRGGSSFVLEGEL
ncbi:NAD(P)/FAD-dependent oxidoreductase [Treponema zuelzerae]|uniref:NAD(P)/FAD-dependent oxidoreductase n=1 Tax=Teretinema zuelzerae TaxID=156 RepID=A0AAE3EI35_9SPIR|nr:NAD(P)/FAD-dependent oxidoreductase [Teretinema zuelzerae]MCD1655415.1 NAD(P)/FAD-dependent oxidoreductase [Teretinema zuelzerae]